MNIVGLQKTTLLDFPETMAATIFTSKCNMRCPFCHNGDLVLKDNLEVISEEEVIRFLKKRQGILEGVCITGGEPTLQNDLMSFLQKIKSLNYKIKLDTNGLKPDILKNVILHNLIDYIAMDIKNSIEKYTKTCGIDINTSNIKESVSIIMNSGIDYEFRTTILKEFHDKEDLIKIGNWLKGADKYFLQQYKNGDKQLLRKKFTAYNKEELLKLADNVKPFIKYVGIRGI